MGKTIGIIQARMGSERLPGKILAPLAGRPMLAQLTARIRPARVDEWWLATTSEPADDATEAWGFELGLRVFRGETKNVLSRFLAIGRETDAEWVVRVTADNPFHDAAVIDTLIDARDASETAKEADLLQLRGGVQVESLSESEGPEHLLSPRLPIGYGVEMVRRTALERASEEIPEDQFHHRVHVTSWLSSGAGKAPVHHVPTPTDWPDRPDWRWTVDTYEDLAMARSAFRAFGLEAASIDYPQMVAQLDAHPEICGMNEHIVQKQLEEG